MDTLTCSMCPAPIHPARHIALPRTTTCSPKCSSDRERWRKREPARRRRQELKALKGDDDVTGSPDPAYCELAVCDRCDSYGDGYSAGKDAAYFAISTWELGAHASDCGCRPCLAIRQAVSKVLLAADEPVLLPDQHLDDCAGPDYGASCGCWCHAR